MGWGGLGWAPPASARRRRRGPGSEAVTMPAEPGPPGPPGPKEQSATARGQELRQGPRQEPVLAGRVIPGARKPFVALQLWICSGAECQPIPARGAGGTGGSPRADSEPLAASSDRARRRQARAAASARASGRPRPGPLQPDAARGPHGDSLGPPVASPRPAQAPGSPLKALLAHRNREAGSGTVFLGASCHGTMTNSLCRTPESRRYCSAL